jgi:hypothetical protein
MRAREFAAIAGVVLVMQMFAAGPAAAGGGATLDFDEDVAHEDYLAVGETVTGEMWAYFDDRQVRREPFYAYLEPVSVGEATYEGPPKLSGKAIRLGRIHVGEFRHPAGGFFDANTRVTFVVPQVAPGRYLIQYCNSPCTRPFGNPGANWPTGITIVATPAEARLRHQMDRLESRLQRYAWQGDNGLRRRIQELRSVVSYVPELRSRQQTVAESADGTAEEVDKLQSQLRDLKSKTDNQAWLLYGLAGIGLMALAVTVARRFRRRRARSEAVDEVVPEWLVRDVERKSASLQRGQSTTGTVVETPN